MKELSYKERFLRSLRLESVDRVPMPAFCTHPLVELMEQTALSAPDIHYKRDDMVKFALAAYEILGLEGVRLPTDGAFEAEAIGCPIDIGAMDRNPSIANHPFKLDDIRIPNDFLSKERIPIYLEAVKTVKRQVGDDIPVTAHFQGPLTMASQMIGAETFLFGLTDKEKEIKALLDIVTGICIKMGNALNEAGADILQLPDGMATSEIISPQMFEEFVQPCFQKILRSIPCPVVLHICGNTTPILPLLKEMGAAGFSFDVKVSVSDAKKILGAKMSLIGNISTQETLLHGNKDDVHRECLAAIRSGINVLAPSCGFAPHTPLENIKEMINTAKGTSGR